MEELSLGVKIIGISICIAIFILLAPYDKLIKMLRRSPQTKQNEIINRSICSGRIKRGSSCLHFPLA